MPRKTVSCSRNKLVSFSGKVSKFAIKFAPFFTCSLNFLLLLLLLFLLKLQKPLNSGELLMEFPSNYTHIHMFMCNTDLIPMSSGILLCGVMSKVLNLRQ
jgi:hypothetical protein